MAEDSREDARDEDMILRHAEKSGFPATKIHAVGKTIDPTTAGR